MDSNAFQRHGDALTHADAHGRERLLARCQIERGGAGDPGARHAQRVAERDGAAIAVHPFVVIGTAEIACVT